MEKEAMAYTKLISTDVKCKLCPRGCTIKNSKRGVCRVRENRNGALFTLIYGTTTAEAIDPIEKKPLFHFWPGSDTYSISSLSCTLFCPWCQNWEISQASPGEVYSHEITSEEIIKRVLKANSSSISYTYNEPLLWYEFVYETSKLSNENKIHNVLVTNGYITEEALLPLVKYIDAANVDIKGFTEGFYRTYCKGSLEPVLLATKLMKRKGTHIEVTNLIIPGINDSLDEIKQLATWVKDCLGSDTPLHFSRFFPHYKMTDIYATPFETLLKAKNIAEEEGLQFVYIGNVVGEGENTYCPNCQHLLIRRTGFDVLKIDLSKDKKCPNCGFNINIIGEVKTRSFIRWF
ncbi:MAG: AmmeMemoRadiSam system radical SAM enzyme [Candidatus Methylarchaceae archaeon HK02M2]|nr:AmmeMemoRadiSam system radical SAM enzyme [Candidatus Methylarchaceae archaeon HK02M2]